MKDVIIKKGPLPGKTSVIFAGVHGNEKCGIEAFENIVHNLTIKQGTVYFILANPKAIEQNIRYTEKNLNRLFKKDQHVLEKDKASYEYLRSRELITYLDKADVLLDIHASNSPDSKPFIICEENALSITSYISIPTTVLGFDELEPGGSDGYMNSIGKIGICIECGYTKDSQSTFVAEKSILEFLAIQKHIDADIKKNTSEIYQMQGIYHTKSDSFRLTKDYADFERIVSGQYIALDDSRPVYAPESGIIMFARNRSEIDSEGFLWGTIKTDQ